ncbi:MAG: hypothetical protein AAFY22_04510 [Pseudomonadota bacterium]
MTNLLFPKQIDNRYRGQWLGLVFFLPLMTLKLLMGFNVAGFNPTIKTRDILQEVDGIPLDTFSVEAASEIVFFGNAWGFMLFILASVGVIALIRYRAMIPFVFLLLTVEQVGRKVMTEIQAAPTDPGAAMSMGSMINWGLSAVCVVGLILTVIPRRNAPEPAAY